MTRWLLAWSALALWPASGLRDMDWARDLQPSRGRGRELRRGPAEPAGGGTEEEDPFLNEEASADDDGNPHPEGTEEHAALAIFSKKEIERNQREYREQERAEKRDGLLVTAMLIGAVLFDMTMLYLMNSSDPQVKSYTYKMLSTGIAVFCALTVENLQHLGLTRSIRRASELLQGNAGLSVAERKLGPVEEKVEAVLVAGVFALWFYAMTWSSHRYRKKREMQHFSLSLVSHVSAFSLLEFLGHLQERFAVHHAHLETHAGKAAAAASGERGGGFQGPVLAMYALFPAGATVFYLLSSQAASAAGQRFGIADTKEPPTGEEQAASGAAGTGEEHRDGHLHHQHHDWKAETLHAEADSMAILVGFLLKQCVVYLVTARPVPMDCAKYPIKCSVDSHSVLPTLAVVLCLYLCVVPISAWHAKHHDCPKWLIRLELLLCMTLSWVTLQLSEWATLSLVMDFSQSDSPLRAKTVKKLLCASALSPLFIMVIVYVDALADWGIVDSMSAEVTVQCIAFLIGFYWEKVFLSSIRNITSFVSETADLGFFIPEVALSVGLLCIIMPAWRWFIVPVACQPVPPREADQTSTWKIFVGLVGHVRKKLRGEASKEEARQPPLHGEG